MWPAAEKDGADLLFDVYIEREIAERSFATGGLFEVSIPDLAEAKLICPQRALARRRRVGLQSVGTGFTVSNPFIASTLLMKWQGVRANASREDVGFQNISVS